MIKTTVKMEEGVSSQFKGEMQSTYTFLVDCKDSVNDCQILEELGFDNGHIGTIKSFIDTIQSEITTILGQVSGAEQDFMTLDQSGTDRLETVYDLSQDEHGDKAEDTTGTVTDKSDGSGDKKDTTDTVTDKSDGSSDKKDTTDTVTDKSDDSGDKKDTTDTVTDKSDSSGDKKTPYDGSYNNSSGGGGGGGGTYTTPDTSTSTQNTTQEPNDASVTTDPYKFDFDRDTAFKAGDIFVDDKYSLTEYTNYLLYKYGITDEQEATNIYMSILRYGNSYYNKNRQNPLKSHSEGEILKIIYDDIGIDISGRLNDAALDISLGAKMIKENK